MLAIDRSKLDIGAMDAIFHRRAVRSYTGEKLDEATIKRLLEAAVQAPTAMHLEPWAFVVVQNAETLKRLSARGKELLLEQARQHEGMKASPGAHREGLLGMLANPQFNIFYNAGTLIAICGKPLGDFVTADCWLAAENLMLAAYAMGLGTCPIGFAVAALSTPESKMELDIPPDVQVIAPIIVGVPTGTAPTVPRKPPEVMRWVH